MAEVTLSPQSRIVLRHLRSVGSITAVEAAAVYRIRSLSRRVSELNEKGFSVDKEFKKDFTGQRYVRYSMGLSMRTCDCPACETNAAL